MPGGVDKDILMKRYERDMSRVKGPDEGCYKNSGLSNGGKPSLSRAEKAMETHNVIERKSGKWSHGGGDTWRELQSMEDHSNCQRCERSSGKGQVRNIPTLPSNAIGSQRTKEPR